MRIDILCNDGSPIGVVPSDIYGENGRIGVGGAELAMLTMFEAWQEHGYEVRLYNSPRIPSENQYDVKAFDTREDRDVLITFRSPNVRTPVSKGFKVWWSCDQYTVGSFKEFSQFNQKIITISPFHKRYFETRYEIRGSEWIDLPVRMQDYQEEYPRIPYRLIFTSVPDRGLDKLLEYWPKLKRKIPQATLVITSDYRLWGEPVPKNEKHRMKWIQQEGVTFLGGVTRDRLVQEQLQADILAYPCTYEELFCIACAEAQVAGAYPITTTIGALETTNMGSRMTGNPDTSGFKNMFIDEISSLLENRDQFESTRLELMQMAENRFGIENILKQWDEKVFKYV